MKKIVIVSLLVLMILFSGCIELGSNEKKEDTNSLDTTTNLTQEPEKSMQIADTFSANTEPLDTWFWLYGTNSGFIAQTFLSPGNIAVDSVELYFKIIGNPEDVKVEIQRTTNDKPNGQVVTSGVLDKNLVMDGWNKIDLVDAQLKEQKMYAIVAGIPDLEPGPVRIYANLGEHYNSGEAFYGNGFTSIFWYNRVDTDYLFKINGKWS